MKRLSLLLLLLAGCSTAPFADLMDYFSPGRIAADKSGPRGGVCGPQQPGPPTIGPGQIPAPSLPLNSRTPVVAPPTPVLGAPVSVDVPPPVMTTPQSTMPYLSTSGTQ
jgi:hypothetical protein